VIEPERLGRKEQEGTPCKLVTAWTGCRRLEAPVKKTPCTGDSEFMDLLICVKIMGFSFLKGKNP